MEKTCDFRYFHFSFHTYGIEELYALMAFVRANHIIDVFDLFRVLEITPAKFTEVEALRVWIILREKFFPVDGLVYASCGDECDKFTEILEETPEEVQRKICSILTAYFREKNPPAQFAQPLNTMEMVETLRDYPMPIRDLLCLQRLGVHDLMAIQRTWKALGIEETGLHHHEMNMMLKFVAAQKM